MANTADHLAHTAGIPIVKTAIRAKVQPVPNDNSRPKPRPTASVMANV